MPNQPRPANPLESIENLSKKAAKPIKQAASDVASDVVESFGLSGSSAPSEAVEQGQAKPQSQSQPQSRQTGDVAKLQQARQNLARINQEIMEARKQREQKDQQRQQQEQRQQVQQVVKEQEKKKDSVLSKLLKSRKGTKEGMQRASG